MISKDEIFGYEPKKEYSKPVAYFSMEFAIDQSLKIYSGGLGFLARSHMRSAYELRQNLVGIGMLWKYGYYDQVRSLNGTMKAEYVQKYYSCLTDTGIVFPVEVHSATVYVKAFLLKPEVFGSAPVFYCRQISNKMMLYHGQLQTDCMMPMNLPGSPSPLFWA